MATDGWDPPTFVSHTRIWQRSDARASGPLALGRAAAQVERTGCSSGERTDEEGVAEAPDTMSWALGATLVRRPHRVSEEASERCLARGGWVLDRPFARRMFNGRRRRCRLTPAPVTEHVTPLAVDADAAGSPDAEVRP